MLEEKLDYIKTLPKKDQEKLTESVENLTKEKQILITATEKLVTPNDFKSLEKFNAKFSMPKIEQSTSLTNISFEKSKVLKGTKDITRNTKMLSIFRKKKEVQLINSKEIEFNEIESHLKNYSIPKFKFR